jgi:hypothetical protein
MQRRSLRGVRQLALVSIAASAALLAGTTAANAASGCGYDPCYRDHGFFGVLSDTVGEFVDGGHDYGYGPRNDYEPGYGHGYNPDRGYSPDRGYGDTYGYDHRPSF